MALPWLGVIANELTNVLHIPYEFIQWSDSPTDTFWVGEYIETPVTTEDGNREITFILTGTTSGAWSNLEDTRKVIQEHFCPISGLKKHTDVGTIIIFYDNAFPIPTGVMDLKRMEINLRIEEWRII